MEPIKFWLLFSYISQKCITTALTKKIERIYRLVYTVNGFGFICNDMITTKYLWKDGINLQYLGASILRKNFIKFVNNCLFSNFDDRF